MKVLGSISIDPVFVQIANSDAENQKKFNSLDSAPIFNLIFYFLNHFSIKKLQQNSDIESKLPDFIVYNENDLNDELKEKILLNSLLISEIIDVLICFLSSSFFSYQKVNFFN